MIPVKGRLQLLQKAEFFSPLPPRTLRTLITYTEEISHPPETYLFRKGAPPTCLYILAKGSVSILQEKEDSTEEQEIARYVEGDSFGELDLLTGSSRNASAKTLSEVTLLRFPAEGVDLSSILKEHPNVGARVLQSFLVVIAGRIRKANNLLKENSPWIQEIRKQVYGDKLTGLYNRTFLEERLPELLKDPEHPVSVLMVKPDNFKQINDTYGHEAGDQALVRMASTLRSMTGPRWIVARFMGNELGIVLPEADKLQAEEVAKAIQKAYQGIDLSDLTGGVPFRISVSIGIAVFPLHASDAPTLIAKAHELPLIGRERGGNQILFPPEGGGT